MCIRDRAYKDMNKKIGKEQYLVPYLMSSHPGSTLKEAIELAEYLRDLGYMPEQVQDFCPTPSTMSTCTVSYTHLGFPGETQDNHEELIQFVNDMEFDRLGAFTYSPEEGTKL